ncbi:helix-turn-helix domain-containing protein [Muricauda sp. JGD-17]|uniref:Helix-turn-helix domain-containing protein n=1 Tax=Flagellimonas ochracea TaxID=2696472 RepID=A0A964WYS3_9FLAO|nr:helix-turn-helix domain-containing protein [Allomuricauda ochracea]NAY93113.1 helix-turn-helix domain-containing protein [Allomuricauda ochracea]
MNVATFGDVSLLLNALGAGNGFLLFIMFLRRNSRKCSYLNLTISLIFLTFSIIILNTIINSAGLSHFFKTFEDFSNAINFTLSPLLFIYIKSLSENENYLKAKSVHFVPFYLCITILLCSLISTTEIALFLRSRVLDSTALKVIWNLHFLTYILLPLKLLNNNRVKDLFLPKLLIFGVGLIWLLNLSLFVYSRVIEPVNPIVSLNIALGFTLIIVWYSFKKLNSTSNNYEQGKYLNINLNEQLQYQNIDKVIWEKKYFRKPGLNIRELSDILEIPYFKLSAHLNNVHHKNFNEYINSYRIKEVVHNLQSNLHYNYTIAGLAKKSGFKSTSSFYEAFKKETGTTPKDFIKRRF